MSRSRKKNWFVKDRNPFMKNYANRRLRRIKIVVNDLELGYDDDSYGEIVGEKTNLPLDNKSYKKYTCSYDISDWCWYSSEQHITKYVNRWFDDIHWTPRFIEGKSKEEIIKRQIRECISK